MQTISYTMITKTLTEEIESLRSLITQITEEVKGLQGTHNTTKREQRKEWIISLNSTLSRLTKEQLKLEAKQLSIEQ